MTPEERARAHIDHLLAAAGWRVQDRAAADLGAARGVAIREFPLASGEADYLLFVDRKALGAIEAKKTGVTLTGVEPQSAKYASGLPKNLAVWRKPLPFLYESTGVETYFTDGRDPDPRSRRVFAFHRPETLLEWAQQPASLRARLAAITPLPPDDPQYAPQLWPAQMEAVANLERSLAHNDPRALIQMATGSGKTYTAITFIYRLLKHAGARRVLFLVDRNNLGRQALTEFQQYVAPDDGRKFTELYNVQRLQSNHLDPVAKVCITTIQRMYSILSGEPEFDPANEDASLFEAGDLLDKQPPKLVQYNPAIPLEQFDFIVTDECHRSIYNLWRGVLEYFDAFLIGLTATPGKHTLGFFNQNLVMEYTRPRAVLDRVNVDGQVYVIRTQITEQGSTVEAGEWVAHRSRQTRAQRLECLDDDLVYTANQLDREVVSEAQIRLVMRTFKDKLFTEIFPGRQQIPKTLIFAKDDAHAETIVRLTREIFGHGNAFCQKITYRVTGVDPESLIQDFRNAYDPRIAVTVDMIATGVDIKPLEILLFLRPVRSASLFEQMLGRGTRVINPADLQAVTGDAQHKTHFVIVDAVGVVDNPKIDKPVLNTKRSVPLAKLLEAVSFGATDGDTLETLAGRLAGLERRLSERDRLELAQAVPGLDPAAPLRALAEGLLQAADPDQAIAQAQAGGHPDPAPEQVQAARDSLIEAAVRPLFNPQLRKQIIAIQQRDEQTIDLSSVDVLREAGFSAYATEQARATVESFQRYLAENRDEITALQLLFNAPASRGGRSLELTFEQVKDLAERLALPPNAWTTESLWQAYALLEKDRVRGLNSRRVLTDIIALVRHAVRLEDELAPYPEQVQARYQAWLQTQQAAGRVFSDEQRWWLDQIAAHIAVNLSVAPDDFDYGEFFNRGGVHKARQTLGAAWPAVLDELNAALVV